MDIAVTKNDIFIDNHRQSFGFLYFLNIPSINIRFLFNPLFVLF